MNFNWKLLVCVARLLPTAQIRSDLFMLPYGFALIVSPFSYKCCKTPMGNYWGSPRKLFPATCRVEDTSPGLHAPGHMGHMDSHSQKWVPRNKLVRGMAAALWLQPAAAVGDWGLQLGYEKWSSILDFEVRNPNACLKHSEHHHSTQFYSDSATQRWCESFIPARLIVALPRGPWKFASRQEQKSKFILESLLSFDWKGCNICYFLQLFPHILPLWAWVAIHSTLVLALAPYLPNLCLHTDWPYLLPGCDIVLQLKYVTSVLIGAE